MPVAFRRTREEQSDMGAIWSWLRLGEIEAEKMNGPKFDKNKFERALKSIRSFTKLSPEEFLPKMRKLCVDSGVAFVLIPAIPRAHVSGVARWLNPHKPLIQMSLYGKTNDRFWFTFFHEAAHILKHDKKDVFLDEFDGNRLDSSDERDADKWASDFLIPIEYIVELPSLRSKESVNTFATKIGVHPGIVVGRLQHEELITHLWMNGLKVSYRFKAKENS
jgi:HTH-type transcriptional regulator/antitoxin HigA